MQRWQITPPAGDPVVGTSEPDALGAAVGREVQAVADTLDKDAQAALIVWVGPRGPYEGAPPAPSTYAS